VELRDYSLRHRQFVTGELPPLLSKVAKRGIVADLGCGDGAVLSALADKGLLEGAIAVDISPERVAAATSRVSGARGVVASASNTDLSSESVDGVICSQVIEHMPDHERVAGEIARILRPGGWWYVSTILRRPRAWWLYRVDGERRLDPTHLREYRSAHEVLRVLSHPDLRVEETRIGRLPFPVSDLVLRAAGRSGLISYERAAQAYASHSRLRHLRRLAFSPPGYRMIEIVGVKGNDTSTTRTQRPSSRSEPSAP
jgi:SAM-dependent methyltransferase